MTRVDPSLRAAADAGVMATFGALPLFLLGAQSVTISRDLGFGPAELGAGTGMFFLVAAVSTLAMAPVIDRLPLMVTAVAAGALAATAGIGIALGARSEVTLMAFLGLAGMGNAALQLTANLAVARSVAPGRQGLAYGIKQSANPLAALLAGLMAAAALQVGGWRATYMVVAVASLVMALSHLRSRRVSAGGMTLARPDRPPRHALFVGGAATALASSAAVSVAAFLPGWANRLGMSTTGTAVLVMIVGAASLTSRLVIGGMADRREGGHLSFVSWLLVLGAFGYLLLALPYLTTAVAGAFLAFALGWGWPGLLIFAVVALGREVPGEASSAIQTGAFLGGAVGPPVFGFVVEAAGYSTAWIGAAVAAFTAAALVAWARRMFSVDLALRPTMQVTTRT